MSSKIKLEKIVFTSEQGITVQLSIAEAKDLYDQLASLFGEKVRYVPSQPIIIERERSPWPWNPNPWAEPLWQTPIYHGVNSNLQVSYMGVDSDFSTIRY